MNKYHFIGIGGIGMSALAHILLEKQIPVSGSDLSSNENVEQLVKRGASITKGHASQNISSSDTVVFSSGIKKNNPEYQKAITLKCPMLHRSDLLAQLMKPYTALAVAGTHGKTTVASLLATVLVEAGVDPTFAIGGMVAGVNGRLGKGSYFVAEADESDGSFLKYTPHGAILTNLEKEHLEFYQSEEKLYAAFEAFATQVADPNLLFYFGDDPRLSNICKKRGVSYGFGPNNRVKIHSYQQIGWKSFFDLSIDDEIFSNIEVNLIGEHNALNAAAVFGLARRLLIPQEIIRSAFRSFPGVGRRCEKKGEISGILFVDDYAHHPTEISTTIKAVKQAELERQLIVVFQPHRFTRTRDHFDAFSLAFELADQVLVTDIYSAGEDPIDGVDGQSLVKKMKEVSSVACSYHRRESCCDALKSLLRPHDVVLTLGAGDITQLSKEVLSDFSPNLFTVGLIFGGASCEHEISLRSAKFVSESLNPSFYRVAYFGIDKQGRWLAGDEAKKELEIHNEIVSDNTHPMLDPVIAEALQSCDLFLPILHGTYGEDGTIQGFFEMLGKPYIGPDVRAAAISMDKVITKRLVAGQGIKTPKDLSFGHLSWVNQRKEILQNILSNLKFPLYVKPVHLGSSVGISFVESREMLEAGIDSAFRFDIQVMVEEGKVGCRELEFAVVGNSHSFPCKVPAPGEKIAGGEFVDYGKKYGANAVQTTLDPQMPAEWLERGKKLAMEAYTAVGCSGMTRVDFLLDAEGEFWFFEMNSIPGLQKLSLFPKIWKREGVPSTELLDKLIILACERKRRQNRHFKCLTRC